MKTPFRAIFLLSGLCFLSCFPIMAAADIAREPDQLALVNDPPNCRPVNPSPHDWMKAMEASVGPVSPEAEGIPSLKAAVGWLGWIFALVFLSALLFVQRRIRRQTAFLRRAGDRDCFLIRGSGDRRKGERRRNPR